METFPDKYGRKISFVPDAQMDTYIIAGFGLHATLQRRAGTDREAVLATIETLVPEGWVDPEAKQAPPPAPVDPKFEQAVAALLAADIITAEKAAAILAP